MSNAVANIPQRASLVTKFASRYSLEPEKLLGVLKATAFKQGANDPEVTNEQMAALLVVADQYSLNPFTKEIFAFADKHKGIVPVVSVDGWARIINEREALNGIEFAYDSDEGPPKWCEATIHRKDREKPTVIREYFSECKRDTGPWKSHPRRMLRHKTLIQCARIAFGFAGIYDEDEAERIIEKDITAQSFEIPPERSASANLKAAVTKPAAKQAPQDAPDPAAAPPAGNGNGNGKPKGTLEIQEKYLNLFAQADSAEALDDFCSEANLYEWTADDQGVLTDAYHARKAEIEASK